VNGEFQETEEFCIENGISFDRESSAYDEWSAEVASFRSGMKCAVVRDVDSYGTPMVDGSKVREAIDELDSFDDAVSDPSKWLAALPAKLEPFVVV